MKTSLASRDGLALEAEFDAPADARAALVLCHPHPRLGGTMDAPLLIALRDALTAGGWAVLRFNFRGVGASEGTPSTGEQETADAAGALDFLRRRSTDLPTAIAGWSFGASVALRVAATEPELAACVAIAPAVNPKPEITSGLPADLRVEVPVLVVCGSNDELVAPANCSVLADRLPNARYIELPGANHFFWAKYDDLAKTVTSFLDELV
ncbi:MAG: alpha/beta hydrolase [Actinomycetota bacterium]